MDAVLLVGGTAVPGGLMGLRLRALADAHPDLMAHVVARRGLGFRALLRRGEIGGDVVQGLDEVPAAACAFCICAWRAFNSVASAANCTV
jgi:hypothetical protein